MSSSSGNAVKTSGVCIWLTGRSGAGKTTLVEALVPKLVELGWSYSVLDVVPHLARAWCERTSEGKLRRKAYVASEIARHGGAAICVTVSARQSSRESAREIVGSEKFLEVYVDVPAEVASSRKAQRGKKQSLRKRSKKVIRRLLSMAGRKTQGYQIPTSPDVVVDALGESPEQGAEAVIRALVERGFLSFDKETDTVH